MLEDPVLGAFQIVRETGYGKLGLAPKNTGFWGQHRCFVRFRYSVPSFLSVVSRGSFFDLCSAFCLQVLRQKHAQEATSDLNEVFKNCQNSLVTGCRYTKRFLLRGAYIADIQLFFVHEFFIYLLTLQRWFLIATIQAKWDLLLFSIS